MPSPDQFQASLDAQQRLAQAMAQFSQVPQLLQNQQQALISELTRQFFKPKSLFQNVTAADCNYSYTWTTQNSQYGQSLISIIGTTNPAVAVFNIQDATELKVRYTPDTQPGQNDGLPIFMMFALSPNDQQIQIAPEQFAMVEMKPTSGIDGGGYLLSYPQISELIPCAGNHYIHLVGKSNSNADIFSGLIPSLGGSNSIVFSLSLYK